MESSFEQFIENELTEDEKNIFANNYNLYKDNDEFKDFTVNLSNKIQFLGITRKDNPKQLVEKYFIENDDYIIETNKLINSKGGRPTKDYMLTPNAFKNLCMLIDTKECKKIRQFYIKLFNVINKYISINNQKYENKISFLESKIQKRVKQNYEIGDTVYVFQENIEKNIYKVGSTSNMIVREKDYYSHNNSGKIVFTICCNNKKALEDAVHHSLRYYTFNNRKDWFETDLSVIIDSIKNLHNIFDSKPDKNIIIKKDNSTVKITPPIQEDINQIIPPMQEDINQITPPTQEEITPPIQEEITPPIQEEITPPIQEEITPPIQEEITPPIQEEITPPTKQAITPPNFNKFLEECFIISPDAVTAWIDIGARYRLWSRCTVEVKVSLANFLKYNGYKETFIYENETKINYTAYKGLEMIPIKPIILPDNPSIVDNFIYESCIVNVTGRITCKDLHEEFIKWMNDPTLTKISNDDKKLLNAYFYEHFFAATVHDGTRIRFGFYGVSLKNKEIVGRKSKSKNRKIIEKLNVNTTEIIATYDSITHAAMENNCSISAISLAISTRKNYKGFNFRKKTE